MFIRYVHMYVGITEQLRHEGYPIKVRIKIKALIRIFLQVSVTPIVYIHSYIALYCNLQLQPKLVKIKNGLLLLSFTENSV